MYLTRVLALAATVAASAFPPHAVAAPGEGVVPVEIVKQGERYLLLRGGQPYTVYGAGLEFSELSVFASHGGNSIRTWRTDNEQFTGQELLDEAHKHGVTVALCIEIGRERHGFDYDDEDAVARQLEYARGEVLKYKDHPALLTWIIGNEMNLHFENPGVFDAMNDISKMIHELDGNHPTTTALAGIDAGLVDLVEQRAPDLDFISIQMYGDIVNLPRYLEEMDFTRPYMVTEWGAIGHWEVPKTSWGAPIEQNSSEKAANYLQSYRTAIASDPDRLIGSYVFLWGQKQERTPTWYGIFLEDGTQTEAVDVMQYLWTGSWPENRSPQVAAMHLDARNAHQSVTLAAGRTYDSGVEASDPDGDTLRYSWVVMRESETSKTGGDREEIPEALQGLLAAGHAGNAVLTAPTEPGNYRVFAYVYDDRGHAGHANIPFQVKK
ncbi:MAG: glycoside hydrolase family 2 TIM barrel-domain containing protein [Xanthomonadales bacterium]|nr:glycoside hydrolase family 2 TIM barrel-domain containing protein [Xanthomonadales bacterium]